MHRAEAKTTAITIQTRMGNNIPCKVPCLPMSPEELARARKEFALFTKNKLQFPNEVYERRGPTYDYNCHGLTFLSRRAWLDEEGDDEGKTLWSILADDGYAEVDSRDALPGDIAVYVLPNGMIEHTGVIVWLDPSDRPPVPWILSKWSDYCEFRHRANNSPYRGQIRYMREASDDSRRPGP